MSVLEKPGKFVSEVKIEMSKVSWPTIDELKSSTWVVIGVSLAFALYIFVIDQVLTQIIKIIY